MTIVTTAYPVDASVKRRQLVEQRIASRAVSALLDAGFTLAVAQGDERPEPATRSKAKIMRELGECDDDRLMVYKPDNLPPQNATGNEHPADGWVWFVYGNDGWDVISDYTTNLESHIASVMQYAKTFS